MLLRSIQQCCLQINHFRLVSSYVNTPNMLCETVDSMYACNAFNPDRRSGRNNERIPPLRHWSHPCAVACSPAPRDSLMNFAVLSLTALNEAYILLLSSPSHNALTQQQAKGPDEDKLSLACFNSGDVPELIGRLNVALSRSHKVISLPMFRKELGVRALYPFLLRRRSFPCSAILAGVVHPSVS